MCGIAGFIGNGQIQEGHIRRTLRLMKNRGPDSADYVEYFEQPFNVLFLHSRLSIIDLDPRSNQPFVINDCTLIFNGEIYNYKELRKELEKLGVSFKTSSDTEVLLRSYLQYGEECVEKFEGMWAFAIFDQRKKRVFFSRDRFSEKPMYYLENETGFYFGSEVKFLQSLLGENLSINQDQLMRYLVNGYKSLYKGEDTFFENVKQLPFASNLIINERREVSQEMYWRPFIEQKTMSIDDAILGFRERLLESVQLRLRSDVPMAFCLSGGVDSSAIVSIAAKEFGYDVATFSILVSDERYNERENIDATIADLQCKHTLIDVPKDRFIDRLTQLIEYHDAPIYTISYYIHSLLSESIAKQGYRVVCSGTAADELVTGYYDHFNLYLYEMRHSANYPGYLKEWQENTGKYVRNPYLKKPELYFDDPSIRDHVFLNNDEFTGYLTNGFKEPFSERTFCNSLLRNRMMNEMFHEVIPAILHEDDLNSMFYSIENRSPYLDSKLFEFAYSIPSEYLIQNGYGKFVLRESVKGILNDQVRLDRRKVGFNASIHSLFDMDEDCNKDFIYSKSPIYDLVKLNKITNILEKDTLPNSFSKFLFNFINAKIFMDSHSRVLETV